jgi:diguanylate cyclase (GGDEF)-like protein
VIVCQAAGFLLFAAGAYEIHRRAARPLQLSWRIMLWLNVLMLLDSAVASVLIVVEVYDPSASFRTFSNVSFALLVVVFLITNSFAVIWLAAEALSKDLRELATRDPLTGVLNRREMVEILGREVSRAARRDSRLAAVMLDIDHFKAINDAHGHDVGDRVLVEVTALLKEEKRGSDHLFRYGGEEFLLLLADTDAASAGSLAERLLGKLRERRFVPELELEVTASVGVACLDLADSSGSGLPRAADEALYRAKRGGRDRVESLDRIPVD